MSAEKHQNVTLFKNKELTSWFKFTNGLLKYGHFDGRPRLKWSFLKSNLEKWPPCFLKVTHLNRINLFEDSNEWVTYKVSKLQSGWDQIDSWRLCL